MLQLSKNRNIVGKKNNHHYLEKEKENKKQTSFYQIPRYKLKTVLYITGIRQ